MLNLPERHVKFQMGVSIVVKFQMGVSIVGWVFQLLHRRMTLLWPWITNGLPVMSPQFVEPKFSIYLEIADIVSFVIARYLYCLGKRAGGESSNPEIDPSELGLVRYIITDGKGDWNHENTVGFPSVAMFKGTHWGKFI
jgi:hypothetical protein